MCVRSTQQERASALWNPSHRETPALPPGVHLPAAAPGSENQGRPLLHATPGQVSRAGTRTVRVSLPACIGPWLQELRAQVPPAASRTRATAASVPRGRSPAQLHHGGWPLDSHVPAHHATSLTCEGGIRSPERLRATPQLLRAEGASPDDETAQASRHPVGPVLPRQRAAYSPAAGSWAISALKNNARVKGEVKPSKGGNTAIRRPLRGRTQRCCVVFCDRHRG